MRERESQEVPPLKEPTSVGTKMVQEMALCGDAFKEEGRVREASRGGAQALFFFFLILFIYLFKVVLGLCFCARVFSSCGKWGPLFIAVCGPLTVVASLVAEHRLSNCGSRA